jgi:hypothetical protein
MKAVAEEAGAQQLKREVEVKYGPALTAAQVREIMRRVRV